MPDRKSNSGATTAAPRKKHHKLDGYLCSHAGSTKKGKWVKRIEDGGCFQEKKRSPDSALRILKKCGLIRRRQAYTSSGKRDGDLKEEGEGGLSLPFLYRKPSAEKIGKEEGSKTENGRQRRLTTTALRRTVRPMAGGLGEGGKTKQKTFLSKLFLAFLNSSSPEEPLGNEQKGGYSAGRLDANPDRKPQSRLQRGGGSSRQENRSLGRVRGHQIKD